MIRHFDKQNFDKLIVTFIEKVLTGKRLEGKALMSRLPFIKFVRLFHYQSFYAIHYTCMCSDTHAHTHTYVCVYALLFSAIQTDNIYSRMDTGFS